MHTHDNPIFQNIKIKNLEKSEIEIEGEITTDEFERARIQAKNELGKTVEIPGFRKGHVPEKILIEKIGDRAIMEEAAEIALSHSYPHIVIENKIEVVGRPEILITKIAKGNPLGFKIKVAVYPKFTLPDYKKIARDEMKRPDDLEVTAADISKMLEEFRKIKVGKTKNTDADNAPALDDNFAKELGAENIDDLKNKLKENLGEEKKHRAKEKKRVAMAEKMAESSAVELPEVLVRNETAKMQAQFEEDLKRMGNMTWQDYLKKIGKADEEIKKKWRKDAEKRVVVQIILSRIAHEEKITVDKIDIEGEVEHILKHNKTLDKERVLDYVTAMLTNEKVFQFLESQK